jgi:hypothetical protein
VFTLILRRIASHGLRRIPEIAQREAQKAFEGGSFKGIAVIKPTQSFTGLLTIPGDLPLVEYISGYLTGEKSLLGNTGHGLSRS